jgi:hypothetical protein
LDFIRVERAAMSVIGRLDGQVDEIIIKPVGERNRRVRDETATERAPRPETEAVEDRRAEETERPAARSNPLPVWLL